MWTLNRKSELTKMEAAIKDEALHIHPEEWEKKQADEAAKADKIIIAFDTPADGRGFSIIKQIIAASEKTNYKPLFIAQGALTPDHARMAFQSGFDEIYISDDNVERHTEEGWRSTISKSVDHTYLETALLSTQKPIWSQRHSA